MTDITLYGVPGSPYLRSALIALEEKGLDYTIAAIPPGSSRSEPYVTLNPFGRIPTLKHGDFVLYETQAIVRYLDRAFPSPALTPADPKRAARMDQLMNICDWYVFQGVGNVIAFQRIVGPRLMGLTPDEEAIAAAMPKAHLAFDSVARLLGEQPYLTGDAMSLADVHLAPQMDFLSQTPEWETLAPPDGTIAQWLARIQARPSLQATTWEAVAARAVPAWS
jgi:glutathione S-transferase